VEKSKVKSKKAKGKSPKMDLRWAGIAGGSGSSMVGVGSFGSLGGLWL